MVVRLEFDAAVHTYHALVIRSRFLSLLESDKLEASIASCLALMRCWVFILGLLSACPGKEERTKKDTVKCKNTEVGKTNKHDGV